MENISTVKKTIQSIENRLFTSRSRLGDVIQNLQELEGVKYVARKRYILNKTEQKIMKKIQLLKNDLENNKNILSNLEQVKNEQKEAKKKVSKETRALKDREYIFVIF